MNKIKVFISILYLLVTTNILGQLGTALKIDQYSENGLKISADEKIHADYGLAYPLTYKINIPIASEKLSVYKDDGVTGWVKLEEKTSDDFFNGIEAVRFDYDNAVAYVSIAIPQNSHSLNIQFHDAVLESVQISYQGITKYYDNRDAVVTSTADDWADYCDWKFEQSCREFRKRKMWLSTAIITHGCSEDTWNNIQTQLDSGYVEAIAHSRSHLHTPYSNTTSEVVGCKVDIFNELDLPEQFKYNTKEYVYIWIAPFGNYDDAVDDAVSLGKYLASRMYTMGDHDLPFWDDTKNKYESFGASLEIGPTEIFGAPWPGTDDINVLNSTFDSVTNAGKVYHPMIHPNTDVYLEDYFHQHLDYISGRNNIWYTATGHLFLYQMMLDHAQTPVAVKHSPNLTINKFTLNQNYPNPFNPSTLIKYQIPVETLRATSTTKVMLIIYDILGREITTLVNEQQKPGVYEVSFDASQLSSGTYFYRLISGQYSETKKMMILK